MSTLNKLLVTTRLTHFHLIAGTLERDDSLGLLNHPHYESPDCISFSENLSHTLDFSTPNIKVVWSY